MKRLFFFILAVFLIASPASAMREVGYDDPIHPRIDRFEAETATQYSRIIADGGTVVDITWMNTVIATLKAQGIYTSTKFLGDANMAVKKDAGTGAVSKLYDLSGNNNDAVQATGGNQPIWTAAQQNGKAGLVFDGTDDFLRVTFASALTQPNTVFTGVKATGAATDECTIVDGVATRNMLYKRFTSGVFAYFAGSEAVSVVNDVNIFYLLMGLFNGASSSLYRNGVVISVSNPGTQNMGGVTIGANVTNTVGSSKVITTVGVINASLSTAQRQAVESLINSYYAIY